MPPGLPTQDGDSQPNTIKYRGPRLSTDKPHYFFVERYAESYAAELDHFVECIETGRRPDVGADDGRKAMILCEAALASAKSGRFEPIRF